MIDEIYVHIKLLIEMPNDCYLWQVSVRSLLYFFFNAILKIVF